MTKIDGDYLVTDEASIKSLFYEQNKTSQLGSDDIFQWEFDVLACETLLDDAKVIIPRALVREAIEPVGGATCFNVARYAKGDWFPMYGYSDGLDSEDVLLAPTAITIGKTVGELRKLVEWARG